MMKLFYTAVISLILPLALSQSPSIKNCWRQLCTECGEGALQGPGLEVQCNSKNLVTTDWLNNPSQVLRRSEDADYVCLKMTASNPKIIGDSTDVIRGCTVKMNAENLCTELSGIEQARGKSNVRCVICDGDSCNSAPINTASGSILSLIVIFASKFLLY